MLLRAHMHLGVSSSYMYAFTPLRPSRSRTLTVTAAVKKRPPAQRSAPKQRPGAKPGARRPAQKSSPAPARGLGALFGGAKKAASGPKQAARKATKEVKKAAPLRKAASAGKAAAAGARRAGGSQKIGGTKRIGVGGTKQIGGTKRVGGTSRIGTKRTGAPPPGRIQFNEDTSSTLGAAGVFSLGLATAAFLLFSVFTGIEGTAEAEQVVQSATQSVKSAAKEVASIADSAANQEDSKVAELADKAKDAASQVPSQARSAPSPQVADASPTGKAGIFGFGGQKPSAAEDSQVPDVVQGAKEAVEGKNPTPASSKAPESSSQPAFNLASIFGQGKNETSSLAAADTADNQEDSKIADLADKAKEAASKVPSEARSSPSPQVADSSPTGKAGIFGFGEQKPSAAEDSQVPSVIQDTKEKVEGKNPTPTSSKASESSSQPAFNLANIFDQGKNEVTSVAAADTADNQEDSKVAELADKAKDAASKVPSEARSSPSPQVADASPTGKAGIFGFGGQKPSAAEDSQVPDVIQGAKEAVEGKNPTPTSTNPVKQAGNEVAKVAEESPLEDAAEAARTLVPSPDGLIDPEKAAQNAEAQEKRAVDAPESSFRAASPVGGEGEVSNLVDQGLKGSAAFEELAKKLEKSGGASSAEQFKKQTEVDKQLQAEDDAKRAAAFKADAPGSGEGNSVLGRKPITSADNKPLGAPASSSAPKQAAAAAPTNPNLLIAGGVVVAGIIAAAASQGSGGAEAIQEQAGKAAESVKKETNSAGGSGDGTGDVKDDIASRQKDARAWIDDWRSRSGSK